MYRSVFIGVLFLSGLAGLTACSVRDVRDFAVDQTVHPRASHLVRDVERTAEEIADEEQSERVEGLSADYERFLRESEGDPDTEDEEERSIIMLDPDRQH